MHADFDGVIALVVAIVSSVLSLISWAVTWNIAKGTEKAQETSENRRFFVTLWTRMEQLKHTEPTSPNEETVRHTLNTLDLVALCWQAGVLDKSMARVGFGKLYCQYYDEIQSIIGKVPILDKRGKELLDEGPEITIVYNDIKTELLKAGIIK